MFLQLALVGVGRREDLDRHDLRVGRHARGARGDAGDLGAVPFAVHGVAVVVGNIDAADDLGVGEAAAPKARDRVVHARVDDGDRLAGAGKPERVGPVAVDQDL